MKRILISTAAVLALLASAVFAFGDIARPKESPSPKASRTILYTGLEVKPDSKIYEARLQISEQMLKDIVKGAGAVSSNTSATKGLMQSSTRTIMAGVFMFLAVSFAGVWLARSNQRRNQKAIVAVLAIGACLGFATVMVRANAGPPGYVHWQKLPANLTNGKPTSAGVSIEIVPGDESQIKLLVPMRTNRADEE